MKTFWRLFGAIVLVLAGLVVWVAVAGCAPNAPTVTPGGDAIALQPRTTPAAGIVVRPATVPTVVEPPGGAVVIVAPTTKPTASPEEQWWIVKDVVEKYVADRWGETGRTVWAVVILVGGFALGWLKTEIARRQERRALFTQPPAVPGPTDVLIPGVTSPAPPPRRATL